METRSASRPSHPDDALDWSGRSRSARLARVNKPLRCRPLEGRRDQKSPLRRCFRPRPPLRTRCAGFASGCRSMFSELRPWTSGQSDLGSWRSRSGRLSGLLSGCPPTDTRPQARAKLGEGAISLYCDPLQELSAPKMKKVLCGWSFGPGSVASVGAGGANFGALALVGRCDANLNRADESFDARAEPAVRSAGASRRSCLISWRP